MAHLRSLTPGSRQLALAVGLLLLTQPTLAQPGSDLADPPAVLLPEMPAAPPPVIKPLSWKDIPEIVGNRIGAPRTGLYAGYTRLVFDLPKDTPVQFSAQASGFTLEFAGVFAPRLSSRDLPGQTLASVGRPSSISGVSPELSSWSMESSSTGTVVRVQTPYALRGEGGYKLLRLPHGPESANDRVMLDLSPALANRKEVPLEQYLVPRFPEGTRIVLDPGHGGTDPGAVGAVVEKITTLKMAELVRDLLLAAGAEVTLSRVDDVVFSKNKAEDLRARGLLGRSPQALLVSLHVNSMPKVNTLRGYGIETWWYPNHPQSKALAQSLQNAMVVHTGAYDRKLHSTSLAVLRQAQVPAALVEIGFASHPVDGENLKNENYLQRVALGVAQGIRSFVGTGSALPAAPTPGPTPGPTPRLPTVSPPTPPLPPLLPPAPPAPLPDPPIPDTLPTTEKLPPNRF